MTAPKRRWFRWSLLTLAVIVTVALLSLACDSPAHVVSPLEMTGTAMTETSVRIGMYLKEYGKLPENLDVLPIRPGYINRTTDGWERRLVFHLEAVQFTLTSFGRDGVPGGIADNADLVTKARVVAGEVRIDPMTLLVAQQHNNPPLPPIWPTNSFVGHYWGDDSVDTLGGPE